ncbi:hypothetical protein [Oscillatoria salina]|uniref:hypothetical protein n=1 Tax=Oscillatoria salina TaxID=331517 RepID=UPI0013B61CD9|nr:hypothetical protein [Oscillatoria salina]MBZ8179573.1 hypothetical protein [Oscillatoria salina IIICB1]NET88993.1 hypothetical protein [Kamptonema sp. SIO1D9]
MGKFIYEKSVSSLGYLIIPFIYGKADGNPIYSYALLSEEGHKNHLHKAENPARLYSSNLEEIILIAKKNLDECVKKISKNDYFQQRYTYQKNLIILHQETGKCFYDHYPPNELRNIAAPKLFTNPSDCLNWVKQGLDQNRVT